MFGKKVPDSVKKEAVLDMVDFLLRHGFKPEEAIKISKKFWKKHWKKLREVY